MPTPRAALWWVGAGAVVAIFVLWICPLEPLGGPRAPRRKAADSDPLLLERDDAKMDWSGCGLHLLGSEFTQTSLDEDSFSYLTQLLINPVDEDDEYINIERAIALLPPQMKSTLLDCLCKQQHFFPFLEQNPRNWPHTEQQLPSSMQLFATWFRSRRRHLAAAHHPSHHDASTINTAAAMAPTAVPAPAPASSSPVPSPAASSSTPANSPSPSDDDDIAYSSDDPPEETLSIPPESAADPPPRISRRPKAGLDRPEKADNNEITSSRTMIVAVVLTATGSVLFTSLLLYLYQRFFGKRRTSYAGYNIGHGDGGGGPLLTSGNLPFLISCRHAWRCF